MPGSAREDAGSQEGWRRVGRILGGEVTRALREIHAEESEELGVGKNDKHGSCHSCGCPKRGHSGPRA